MLMYAANNGNTEVVSMLAGAKADVNTQPQVRA